MIMQRNTHSIMLNIFNFIYNQNPKNKTQNYFMISKEGICPLSAQEKAFEKNI